MREFLGSINSLRLKDFNLKWSLVLTLLAHVFIVSKSIKFEKAQNFKVKKSKKIRLVLKSDNKSILKKQIVNTELNGKKEKPKDTAYLGKKDQVFDRQTTATQIGSFKKAGLGHRKGIDKRAVKRKRVVKKKAKRAESKNKKFAKKIHSKKFNKKMNLADLSIGKKLSPAIKEAKSTPQLLKGIKSGTKGKVGLSANNDFIEELPLGDMTNLNTTEFKYYGFYHRIRQKLEQYWGDSLRRKAEQMYKKGRSLASDDNKITALIISLDNGGNIVDIRVKGTSGVNELDQAAVEAFNRAGPFPNPPRGMVKDGRADIEWGFVVRS